MNKKGFTLMEILVVILIIVILVSLYSLTYRKSVQVRNNERARAMLVELANAAKLYNEMFPNQKISGGFGDNPQDCPSCQNPCELFRSSESLENMSEEEKLIYPYALVPGEWGIANKASCGNSLEFQGYKFYICNPYYDGVNYTNQPDGACLDANNVPRFAVLKSPNTESTPSAYIDKQAWITQGYELDNNYE